MLVFLVGLWGDSSLLIRDGCKGKERRERGGGREKEGCIYGSLVKVTDKNLR